MSGHKPPTINSLTGKPINPDTVDYRERYPEGHPHCDNLVLHAPGECEHCDGWPERQQARLDQKIAFTGHDPKEGETICPAEERRPRDIVSRWRGNVASSYEREHEPEL